MKPSSSLRPHAVAFIYDHLEDFAVWIRRLTPGQIESIAEVLVAWHGTVNDSTQIVALSEVERREIIRAVSLCGGDINAAANALRIGRTTLYRKMREWGYSATNRRVMSQACALAELEAVSHNDRKEKSGMQTVSRCDNSDDLDKPTNGGTANTAQPR